MLVLADSDGGVDNTVKDWVGVGIGGDETLVEDSRCVLVDAGRCLTLLFCCCRD